jgi:hypothetical protein
MKKAGMVGKLPLIAPDFASTAGNTLEQVDTKTLCTFLYVLVTSWQKFVSFTQNLHYIKKDFRSLSSFLKIFDMLTYESSFGCFGSLVLNGLLRKRYGSIP